jgi:PHD/YefM family antitoxin component YafN of YafNO toxin-antitoxin module
MNNTVTTSEIKRRGMAAIEDGLSRGPLHILKRNRPAAVVLSEDDYQRLLNGRTTAPVGVSAVQWLLSQPVAGTRSKAEIDADIHAERDAWGDA